MIEYYFRHRSRYVWRMEIRLTREGSKFVIMACGVPFATMISRIQLPRWFAGLWDSVGVLWQRKMGILDQERGRYGSMKWVSLKVKKRSSLLTICPLKWSKIERSFICTSYPCGCSVLIKFNSWTKVFCYGNETQLYRCEHNHWGEHNCNHEEDAGVICTPGDVNDSKVNRNIPSRRRDSLIVS